MRRLMIVFAALAIVATACSSDAEPAAAPSPVETTEAAAAPSLDEKGPITEAEDMPPETAPPASTLPPSEGTPSGSEPPPSDLPSVEVIDLADDTTFNVASLVPSDRPIVVWFWAPH